MTDPKPLDLDGLVREAEAMVHGLAQLLPSRSDLIVEAHAAIDRAVRIARLAGRVEQAEVDMWIAHSDAGCESSRYGESGVTERERGRLDAYRNLRDERARLRDELRRAVEEGG